MNSGADKVTTNTHSQGIRFLREITGSVHSISIFMLPVPACMIFKKCFLLSFDMTGKTDLMDIKKGTAVPHQQMATAKKR